MPSGSSITFSGTVKPITFAANKTYGFAFFSTTAPTATPPPVAQTFVYYGSRKDGITVATETGTVEKTLAIPVQTFDLDDAGNVYASSHTSGGGPETLQLFPAGSVTASASYTPSIADYPFISVSGGGALVAVHNPSQKGVLVTDVWDAGVVGGAPSRSITTQVANNVGFVLAHDGTLYLPDRNGSGAPIFESSHRASRPHRERSPRRSFRLPSTETSHRITRQSGRTERSTSRNTRSDNRTRTSVSTSIRPVVPNALSRRRVTRRVRVPKASMWTPRATSSWSTIIAVRRRRRRAKAIPSPRSASSHRAVRC